MSTIPNLRKHHLLPIAVGLVLLIAGIPAHAGGPLSVCNSGQPFVWPDGGANIPFNPDQGDLGPLGNAAAVAQTQVAFDTWGAVPTATANYVNAGLLPVDVTVDNFGPFLNAVTPDGLSAIVFDDTGEIFDMLFGAGSGILGFAGPEFSDTATCEILEGLSFLNGPAFTDLTAATDVMVHEFGHYSNLAHTVVNGQLFSVGDTSGPTPFDSFGEAPSNRVIETMYPFYFGPGSGTQTLHADDIATLSTLYPAADFLATTGTITGTIFASNGATKLTGINVIARNVADPFEDAVSAISSDFTDDFSQGDGFAGVYTINGLSPGANYVVFVDQIGPGGFSTPPAELPGPEEFYNGPNESNDVDSPDDPSASTEITAAAGAPATADIIFNTFGPGDPLPVGDDGFVELSMPFPFTICGQRFESVFVNANGNLTFGASSTDFSESVAEHLSGPPRIAGVWDDLTPFSVGGPQGMVVFDQTDSTFTVKWIDVPEFPNTGSNNFEITLRRNRHDDGHGFWWRRPPGNQFSISYGSLDATDGLAGFSCGSAVTSGVETETDLSPRRWPIRTSGKTAVFESFTDSDNDLADVTLRFDGTSRFRDRFGRNNTIQRATRIRLPFNTSNNRLFTEIEPAGGDVDYFRFHARAGQSLVAETVNGQLDTVLGLFQIVRGDDDDSSDDASGDEESRDDDWSHDGGVTGVLLASDDDGGDGVLSRIVFEFTETGSYALAVSTFPDFDFDGSGGNTDPTLGRGRYVLDAFTVNGSVLTLGDDASLEVDIGFAFPFQGEDRNSVFVNSNGNLTFGSGDTAFAESVEDLLSGPPRIAALWDDLAPNAGGLVVARRGRHSFTVSFMGVPEFIATGSNTFSVTLYAGGLIQTKYGAVSAVDGLVGVTEGGGADDPGASNLSSSAFWPAVGTTYELFDSSSLFDLVSRRLFWALH